jgi:hypothetical protein
VLIDYGDAVVHVFSDGAISGALEGILYDHAATNDRADLPPSELSHILSGSRVSVLTLSPDKHPTPDGIQIGGRRVLSAYRAFAYLGGSTLPLPTIMAPLGPVPDAMMATFWNRFYSGLLSSWHLTGSLHAAQQSSPFPLPMALFCRHAGGKLFQKDEGAAAVQSRPVEVRMELLQSEELTSGLGSLKEKYGELPDSVRELLDKETNRQVRLRSELGTWINTSEEL